MEESDPRYCFSLCCREINVTLLVGKSLNSRSNYPRGDKDMAYLCFPWRLTCQSLLHAKPACRHQFQFANTLLLNSLLPHVSVTNDKIHSSRVSPSLPTHMRHLQDSGVSSGKGMDSMRTMCCKSHSFILFICVFYFFYFSSSSRLFSDYA